MKITHLLAAGLMAAGIGMSGAASAQMNHRTDQVRDQRGDRADHRDGSWNRRTEHRSYSRHDRRSWGHGRTHCRTEWRHHRRIRVCR